MSSRSRSRNPRIRAHGRRHGLTENLGLSCFQGKGRCSGRGTSVPLSTNLHQESFQHMAKPANTGSWIAVAYEAGAGLRN
jgi:hypothetical protein